MTTKPDRFGLTIVRGERHISGPLHRAYIVELRSTAKQSVVVLKAEGLLDEAMEMLPEYFDEIAGDDLSKVLDGEFSVRRDRLFTLALTCLHASCLRHGRKADDLFASNGLVIQIGEGAVHGIVVDDEPESIHGAASIMAFQHPTLSSGTLH